MSIPIFRRKEMKSSSLILMGIAVVAVGMFALPSTVSLFAGQHTWYDLGGTGNDLPCEKCHAEIFDEFQNTGVHWTLAGGSGSTSNSTGTDYSIRLACGACHRANKSITYASGDTASYTAGDKAHAASTVACMVCHEFNASVHTTAGWPAGGFNISKDISPYNYTPNATYSGKHAAHNLFIVRAIEDSTMEDSNEACIACHTHVPVKINWTHRVSLEFNCTPEFDLPPAHFNVTDWAVNGTTNATVYGNTSGFGATNSTYWPGENPDGYSGGGY